MSKKYGYKLWLPDGSYAILQYDNFKFEVIDCKKDEFILFEPKEF